MNSPQISNFVASLSHTELHARPASSSKVDPLTDHKLRKAAAEFEGQLLSALWKSMKTSFADSSDDSLDPAGQSLEEYGIDAMSQAVGKAGGLGIGKLVVDRLEAQIARSEGPGSAKGR